MNPKVHGLKHLTGSGDTRVEFNPEHPKLDHTDQRLN